MNEYKSFVKWIDGLVHENEVLKTNLSTLQTEYENMREQVVWKLRQKIEEQNLLLENYRKTRKEWIYDLKSELQELIDEAEESAAEREDNDEILHSYHLGRLNAFEFFRDELEKAEC